MVRNIYRDISNSPQENAQWGSLKIKRYTGKEQETYERASNTVKSQIRERAKYIIGGLNPNTTLLLEIGNLGCTR